MRSLKELVSETSDAASTLIGSIEFCVSKALSLSLLSAILKMCRVRAVSLPSPYQTG